MYYWLHEIGGMKTTGRIIQIRSYLHVEEKVVYQKQIVEELTTGSNSFGKLRR